MSSEDWPDVRLGDLGRIVTGRTPPGTRPECFDGEIPFITPTDMTGCREVERPGRYLSSAGAAVLKSVLVPRGVAVSCIGWQMGKSLLITRPSATNQQINTVVPDGAAVDLEFLYYALSARRKEIFRLGAGGSRTPILNKSGFANLKLPLPSLSEQRRIARTLGVFDDKIELNHRMSRTLESIARAIFKSWFVDFDPVRQKIAGGDTGFPSDIAASFPNGFEESCGRVIPKGWAVRPLETQASVARGLSYGGAGLSDSGTPMHNLNSLLEGGGHKPEGMKHYIGAFDERHRVGPGDVLVANTEQGHGRRLIGFACLVPRLHGEVGIFTHHLFRVCPLPSSPLSSTFLYYHFNCAAVQAEISGYATGTTVNTLPPVALQRPLVVVPPADLIRVFSTFAGRVLELQEASHLQSLCLIAMREALLPRLLIGELGLRDADNLEVTA